MGGHIHDLRDACLGWVCFLRISDDIGGCRAPLPGLERFMESESLKEQLSGPDFHFSISADGEYGYDDGSSRFTFKVG